MVITQLVADLQKAKNKYGDITCLNQSMKDIYFSPEVYVRDKETGKLYDIESGDGIIYSIAISKGDPNFSFSVIVG